MSSVAPTSQDVSVEVVCRLALPCPFSFPPAGCLSTGKAITVAYPALVLSVYVIVLGSGGYIDCQGNTLLRSTHRPRGLSMEKPDAFGIPTSPSAGTSARRTTEMSLAEPKPSWAGLSWRLDGCNIARIDCKVRKAAGIADCSHGVIATRPSTLCFWGTSLRRNEPPFRSPKGDIVSAWRRRRNRYCPPSRQALH